MKTATKNIYLTVKEMEDMKAEKQHRLRVEARLHVVGWNATGSYNGHCKQMQYKRAYAAMEGEMLQEK